MSIIDAQSRSRPREGLDELSTGFLKVLFLVADCVAGLPWSGTETQAPQQLPSQSLLETELELSHNFTLLRLPR